MRRTHQRSHYGNETSNVEDHDEHFDLWQPRRDDYIDEDAAENHRPNEQSTLPWLRRVGGIVQDHDALDDCPREERLGCYSGNPCKRDQPPNDIAEDRLYRSGASMYLRIPSAYNHRPTNSDLHKSSSEKEGKRTWTYTH